MRRGEDRRAWDSSTGARTDYIPRIRVLYGLAETRARKKAALRAIKHLFPAGASVYCVQPRDFELNSKSGRPAPRFYGSRVSNVEVPRPLAAYRRENVGKTSGKRRDPRDESPAEGVIGIRSFVLRSRYRIRGRDRSIPFSIWTVAERHRSVLLSAFLPPSPSPGTIESRSTPTRGFAAVSLQLVASVRLPRHR